MLHAALVLARLRSHLGRSLVLVVVVAVAAGIALRALAVLRVADDPWAPLQAATRGADVEIDAAPARPDPRALAALPEVATLGSLIQSGDTALRIHGQILLVSLKRMPADREAMVVDRPRMMVGRWFAADDEVVFEATLADTLGVEVGDTVALNGEHGRTARVVGTAATTMLPNYPERLPGSIFASGAVFDAIDPVGAPRWSIGLRLRDPSQADAVVARLNASGPVPPGNCTAAGWCARTAADIRDNAFPSRVDEFAGVMLFFAVLMLIAAVLLIVTLLGSRLVSEARELTLLQVVGATPTRLALLIASEHALLAVAGAAAGILVARVVAPRIAESAATVFGSVSPRLSLGDVMVVIAAAVAVSVLVSALGGLRAGRRSLAVVARGGAGRIGRSRAAALAMRSTSWATLVLGLKDIATRRGRAAVTVLSVAPGGHHRGRGRRPGDLRAGSRHRARPGRRPSGRSSRDLSAAGVLPGDQPAGDRPDHDAHHGHAGTAGRGRRGHPAGGGVDVDPGAAQGARRAPRGGLHHRPAHRRLGGQPGRPWSDRRRPRPPPGPRHLPALQGHVRGRLHRLPATAGPHPHRACGHCHRRRRRRRPRPARPTHPGQPSPRRRIARSIGPTGRSEGGRRRCVRGPAARSHPWCRPCR